MLHRRRIAVSIRWLARIIGGLALLLFPAFAVGERQTIHSLSSKETAMFVCLGAMLLGVVASYWRVLVGCAFIILGYAGFVLLDRDFNLDNPFLIFPVILFLYVMARVLEGRRV